MGPSPESIRIPMVLRDRYINGGGLFVLNDSGGKDSQAMRIIVRSLLPAMSLVVIHAPLGEIEWPGALEHAQAGAKRDGLKFITAPATKTFLEMVEHRHATKPSVPCWPSKSCRQCTSDLKRGPIEREIRREAKARGLNFIVNCVGYRWQESTDRRDLPEVSRSDRNSKAGREWWNWHPILHLTEEQVFETISKAGESPHPAYGWGNQRLSCLFCIMGSKGDLRNAAQRHPQVYWKYVELERRTGYTMHQSRISLPILTGVEVA